MSEYLPQDVMENILSRLPGNSLARFRCVSKSWRATIDDPRFIDMQYRRSMEIKSTKIVVHGYHKLCVYDYSTRRGKRLSFESLECVVGSCNGLVCLLLRDGDKAKYSIFNPSAQNEKPVQFNACEIRAFSGEYTSVYGFGYDESNKDYKIVELRANKNGISSKIFVYSTNKGSWRQVGGRIPHKVRSDDNGAVFVSGTLHWVTQTHSVFAFDCKDESVELLPLPGEKTGCMRLMELRGKLSVILYYKRAYEIWIPSDFGVEELWTKLYAVDDPIVKLYIEYWKPRHTARSTCNCGDIPYTLLREEKVRNVFRDWQKMYLSIDSLASVNMIMRKEVDQKMIRAAW